MHAGRHSLFPLAADARGSLRLFLLAADASWGTGSRHRLFILNGGREWQPRGEPERVGVLLTLREALGGPR